MGQALSERVEAGAGTVVLSGIRRINRSFIVRLRLCIVNYFVSYNAEEMKDSPNQTESSTDQDPVIEAYKKHIDRTLIRENLRLTVDQRFQQLMKLQRFAEQLQTAGQKAHQKQ